MVFGFYAFLVYEMDPFPLISKRRGEEGRGGRLSFVHVKVKLDNIFQNIDFFSRTVLRGRSLVLFIPPPSITKMLRTPMF